MILWRISRHLELSGTGGLRLPGRWHHVGQPVVYLATSPAAALLEVCVHTSANDVPPSFTLLRVEAAEDLSISEIDPATLPPDWPSHQTLTRDLGTEWLQGRSSALLRVPSAIVPDTVNVLFNPLHPQAEMCMIAGSSAYPFDLRIKK